MTNHNDKTPYRLLGIKSGALINPAQNKKLTNQKTARKNHFCKRQQHDLTNHNHQEKTAANQQRSRK